MHSIELTNIRKHLGDFELNLPELNIEEGYITGFVGKNGAGKTTTMKLIMGMLFPDQGNIRILGQDLDGNNKQIKNAIGYVGNKTGFYPELKLKHIKNSVAPFYSNWDEPLYRSYMEKFRLDENKTYQDLSTGKKRQYDLLLALSHHPRLILLDEPTANLDPVARNEFLDLFLEQMEKENISIFYSTHIISDLEKAADYIIFLHDGKILLQDTKDNLLENYRIVRGKSEFLTTEIEQQLFKVTKNSFGFEGLTNNWQATFELLGNEVIYDKASLEDIFIAYTKGINN